MAMNGTTLGTAITSSLQPVLQTEIKTQLANFFVFGADPFSQDQINKFAQYLSTAIANKVGVVVGTEVVNHIVANAAVTASGPDPQGGTQTVTGTVA